MAQLTVTDGVTGSQLPPRQTAGVSQACAGICAMLRSQPTVRIAGHGLEGPWNFLGQLGTVASS